MAPYHSQLQESHTQILSLALPLPDSQVTADPLLRFRDSPVVVHDCVESVGDGQYSAVFKLGTDGALDEVIRLQVNGSSGLI